MEILNVNVEILKMNIELNLISCDSCGVYLDLNKVEKNILTLPYKERYCGDRKNIKYLYISGFVCPVCHKLHIKEDFYEHKLKYVIEEDDDVNNSINIFEYMKKKLNITEKYYTINFYGERDEE